MVAISMALNSSEVAEVFPALNVWPLILAKVTVAWKENWPREPDERKSLRPKSLTGSITIILPIPADTSPI